MIDATFVEVPQQRNSREENAQIKAGETPADWQHPAAKAMLRQKDVDTRWTKRNNENHYGYKNYVSVDQAHKLIQGFEVTDAAVHDSMVFDNVLDQTAQEDGSKRDVYADSVPVARAGITIDQHLHPQPDLRKRDAEMPAEGYAKSGEQGQVQSARAGRTGVWRAGTDGWAHCAHDQDD